MAELRWKVVTDRGTTTGTAEWNVNEPLRLLSFTRKPGTRSLQGRLTRHSP